MVEGWFRDGLCVGDQAMPGVAGTILQNYLHGTRIFCYFLSFFCQQVAKEHFRFP